MATAPQTAMNMPQEAASNPFSDPNTMAVYDQMRQTVSPKEFGDEMLASASQAAPEDVAAFRSALEQIDLPPEALDLLNNMVDEILANPEQYAEIRAKYSEMGAPDEILPEQFDPEFFAALNMAVDQMIAAPAGVQAFAQGGIAELKPIAKAIAGYGRNGDTMLAHITPAEARMLRRRGGSGTINPKTGLPEFFNLFKELKNGFKAIGKAVKSFAKSTVGKIVLTVALGYFLGPAAASMLSVSSAAGVAAVSGFVGSAGSTLLAGGNLKDALKAGAVGGLTAGAIGGVTQGFDAAYTGPTTVGGQVDKFTNMISPSAAAPAPSSIQAPTLSNQGLAPTDAPVFQSGQNLPSAQTSPVGDLINPAAGPLPGQPGSDIMVGGKPAIPSFSPEFAAGDPGAGFEPYNKVFADAPARVRAPLPGQPGSDVRVGGKPNILAIEAAAQPPVDATQFPGSFDKTGVVSPPAGMGPTEPPSFLDRAKTFYNENISPSGIQEQAAPQARQAAADAVAAAEKTLPASITGEARAAMLKTTYDNALKTAMPGIFSTYAPITAAGLGAVGLAGGFTPTEASPSTLRPELMKPVTQRIAEGGNQKAFYVQNLPGVKYDEYGAPVFGQYNSLPTYDTGLGIASLVPKSYADGGFIGVGYAEGGVVTAEEKAAAAAKAAEAKAVAAALVIKQAADRKAVVDAEAAEKAAGFGNAYRNINAGLSYDVPAGVAAPAIAARQAAFTPTMDKFVKPKAAAAGTALPPATLTPAFALDLMYRSSTSGAPTSLFNQYGGYNAVKKMAMDAGFDATPEWQNSYRTSTGAATGAYTPTVVAQPYNNATGYSNLMAPATQAKLMNMGGIASLRSGGYPRRTGQISGPGTPTSDSIPAMLSDGEFVMTEKAVRGAGKGDRRAGAKRMYALMNQLEKNAARG